ncbi:Thiol:disulfide interchange protein DsbC precursor [compost metagenome]
MPELNKRGIEVRYLAFPRQGPNSSGDQQLQAIWCSKDRPAALNDMFHEKEVKAAKCDNPVNKQFELGQMVGVQGTPAIILADGQMLPGYQSAGQIAKLVLDAK